jgi:hypothetical protein
VARVQSRGAERNSERKIAGERLEAVVSEILEQSTKVTLQQHAPTESK